MSYLHRDLQNISNSVKHNDVLKFYQMIMK